MQYKYSFNEQVFHIILPKTGGMSIKTDIENLLMELRKYGKDRRTIERELNYSPHYIDQLISKGGNIRFYTALKKYYDMLTQEERHVAEDHPSPSDWTRREGQGFWQQIPEYRHCDFATKARGTGMQPLIQNNAIVGGKELTDPSLMIYGEIYIVQTKNGMEIIRYAQPAPDDPDSILFVPHRENTPGTQVRRSDIVRVFLAQFVVNPL
jgi:hypothetical protein